MRVRLKGLNRITKKLASGKSVTYYYAWKGGPRLEGTPGSPEFIASYNRAVEARRAAPKDQLQTVFDGYEASTDFADLAPRTQKDYRKLLRVIESEFGDFPIAALEDRRTRGEFLAWRERLAVKSRRQADYAYAVLARTMSWALNRGIVAVNPCERPGRLYRAARSDSVWTEADEAAFYAKAPAHLHLALRLALWTGQRQGDLLRLTWAAYDGDTIRLRQRKTKVPVVVPVGAPLRAALDAAKEKLANRDPANKKPLPMTILATENGTTWTESGFRASWRKACAKAGVVGVTFHDLRGTAVTRLAVAGCTPPEIATITGHSLRDVGAIMDAHYLHRDPELGKSAIAKLERGTKTPN
ncbi:tyrosine-type recombinase/integrase [Sphingobium chlorophenolicum]|uniref:Putative integrase n=1 Tax=Sphingobium chlorophenolicum TaxID=46429 RepID=A0A081RFJ1_SPHCR|nr:tyrosine-type recombinase/integrase [Sphingobium chlorophenolicum]KEQ53964.1 putative integrase [Sphingobium chlorophenolicum]